VAQPLQIGLISDTHGLLRAEARDALAGVDLILHAGDIGKPEVLADLATLAPVQAVRGNVDRGAWADRLPEVRRLSVGEHVIVLAHQLAGVEAGELATGAAIVVFGHSHRPVVERRGTTLYVNPGSAGPRRFRLPVAVGRLALNGPRVRASVIELDV